MSKETVPSDDAGDSVTKTAYNDFPTFARISMESGEWRKHQVVPCGYSCVSNVNVPTKVAIKVSDGQTWFRPNRVWMSERVYRFFAKLPPKRPRRFRPVNVRRLRTRVRVKR